MNLSQFSLENRVAIVTGAGRGIGKAIALGLADAGAKVVVAARTVTEIEDTASEIKGKGKKAIVVPTDVRLSDQVNNLVNKAVTEFGTIDILVNNAGGTFSAPTMEMSENAWDAIIRENLKSVFMCSQTAGKVMMAKKKGVIVNIASIVGFHAQPLNAAYAAAKAGVTNLTKTMATDLAQYNIRVNAIAPGHIITSSQDPIYGDKRPRMSDIPLARAGRPEDIAGGVIYLASDASSYVTGHTIIIDGGAIIKCSIGLE